jgi:hypothetical protein
MKEDIEDVLAELLEFIEENNVSDINEIKWLSEDVDCFIESDRSIEFKELLKKASEAVGEE